jgi:hypothetical protein
MKTLCCAVTAFVFGVTGATAQSLEQRFDQLGSKLEAAQQSLTRPAPTPGTTFQLWEDAPVYTRPEPSAITPMKLNARAPVTFQGVEKGFAKVTTPGSQTIYYASFSVGRCICAGDCGQLNEDRNRDAEGHSNRPAAEPLCPGEGLQRQRFDPAEPQYRF